MKILFQQFLGNNHSWAHTSLIIINELIKLGYDVELFSTDGITHFPLHLKKNLIGYFENGKIFGRQPSSNYDCEYSYTSMKNFNHYLNHSPNAIRLGCWIFEFNSEKGVSTFPYGFSKNYKYVDKILVPSRFGMDGFLNAGVPSSHLVMMPHAISENFITGKDKYKFNSSFDGKFKYLLNLGQIHRRKNLEATFTAWGKAFTSKDNVILIAKINDKSASMPFEQNWSELLGKFKEKYKNHAPIYVIKDYIEDISSLYRACEAVIAVGQEGFSLTALEGLYSNKIVIALNYSGNLDFCNENNSLLLSGNLKPAPANFQYWEPSKCSMFYYPNIDHYVELLRTAAKNKNTLLSSFQPHIDAIKPHYTPTVITNKILDLYHSLKK